MFFDQLCRFGFLKSGFLLRIIFKSRFDSRYSSEVSLKVFLTEVENEVEDEVEGLGFSGATSALFLLCLLNRNCRNLFSSLNLASLFDLLFVTVILPLSSVTSAIFSSRK